MKNDRDGGTTIRPASDGDTAGIRVVWAANGDDIPDGGVDIQTVGMEFSFILTQVRKAAEILEVGAVQEVSIRTGSLTMLIRVVSPEYFVALAIRPDGNFGKGRYLLRLVAPKLQAEIA